mgnify:CR=1 FL=1
MEFITIKKAHNPSELMVLKSYLEANDIPCYVKNENITQLMNYMPTFVAELQIMESDQERVNQLIQELDEEHNKA